MRKLDSYEKNGVMYRIWYLQNFDLKTIKELDIPTPSPIKEIIDIEFKDEELDRFVRFSDPISFEFIKNQYYLLGEEEIINLNLYELNLGINKLLQEKEILLNKFKNIDNKEELEEIRIELILNENAYRTFLYMKKQKVKESRIINR